VNTESYNSLKLFLVKTNFCYKLNTTNKRNEWNYKRIIILLFREIVFLFRAIFVNSLYKKWPYKNAKARCCKLFFATALKFLTALPFQSAIDFLTSINISQSTVLDLAWKLPRNCILQSRCVSVAGWLLSYALSVRLFVRRTIFLFCYFVSAYVRIKSYKSNISTALQLLCLHIACLNFRTVSLSMLKYIYYINTIRCYDKFNRIKPT